MKTFFGGMFMNKEELRKEGILYPIKLEYYKIKDLKSKNDIFYLIVLILTIITLMVGITFTYFSLVAKEKDDSTKVKTGSIAINYIDGASINSNGLIPRKEPSLGENYAV